MTISSYNYGNGCRIAIRKPTAEAVAFIRATANLITEDSGQDLIVGVYPYEIFTQETVGTIIKNWK